MKKLIYLVLFLSLFVCCEQKQEEAETIIEDGVEVVINHVEPYKIQGEHATFNLEEMFEIDTENFSTVRIGLTDISCFDVDSRGNIYFLRPKSRAGNYIFKFGKNGRYVTSFGPLGQGPGEFQYPLHLEVDHQDNIVVTDQVVRRVVVFKNDGSLKKEIKLINSDILIAFASCLENGNFLILGQLLSSLSGKSTQVPLRLVSSQFEEIKELDRYERPKSRITKRFKGTPDVFCWSTSKKRVYIGNEDRGYEIWVYDLVGNLIRKIKKEYKKVPVSEKFKKKRMEILPDRQKKIAYFPEFLAPYQSFFADDSGRLYVMTYEEGENPGEFICDIFNPDGVFIGRKSLNVWVWNSFFWAKTKKNLFYCLQEKESGYKKLVVYKMKWEE